MESRSTLGFIIYTIGLVESRIGCCHFCRPPSVSHGVVSARSGKGAPNPELVVQERHRRWLWSLGMRLPDWQGVCSSPKAKHGQARLANQQLAAMPRPLPVPRHQAAPVAWILADCQGPGRVLWLRITADSCLWAWSVDKPGANTRTKSLGRMPKRWGRWILVDLNVQVPATPEASM